MFEEMVTVDVCHPMGSVDEEQHYYPINCGLLMDGETRTDRKVYIFGVNGPVSSYLGRVIARVTHENDPEGVRDSYVVAPYIHSFTPEYIKKNLSFADSSDTLRVIMIAK